VRAPYSYRVNSAARNIRWKRRRSGKAVVVLCDATEESVYGRKAVRFAQTSNAGLPIPVALAFPFTFVEAITYGSPGPRYLLDWVSKTVSAPVAVRSSSMDDFLDISGLNRRHPERLNIRTLVEVIDAIKSIWHEFHAGEAMLMRRQMGFTETPRVAVIIQEMVFADVAGLLFTRDPLTGLEEAVIEACWGHEEAVTAGLTEPDRYKVARDGTVLHSSAGNKDGAIRFYECGMFQTVIGEEKSHALCLNKRQIGRLNQIALKCEKVFGKAQVIEWAIAGKRVYILQRSPVERGV